MQSLRHFLLAVQFLTRIPVTGRLADWVGYSPALLRASAVHFPGVGWLVGAWVAGVLALLLALLPPTDAARWVAALFATAAGVWLTGAFHEDGLADTADALGGAVGRDRALEIMKDSRIGSYGAMALVLVVLLKCALLALLAARGTALVVAAVVATQVGTRYALLWLMALLPHVGDAAGSKSKPLADAMDALGLAKALLWTAPALVLLASAAGAGAALAATAGAAFAAWRMLALLRRRLGGYTGDGLGATQQVTEVAALLALALALALALGAAP